MRHEHHRRQRNDRHDRARTRGRAHRDPANSTGTVGRASARASSSTISTGWAERPDILPPAREQAPYAARRRDAVSAAFPGKRLIVPAGPYQVRSNDTDYPFRAHSAFSHLTGWASDSVPDSVLVFEPNADVRPRRDAVLPRARRPDHAASSTRTRRSASSGSARGPHWRGSPPTSASRPRTSTRSRRPTTTSSWTMTPS